MHINPKCLCLYICTLLLGGSCTSASKLNETTPSFSWIEAAQPVDLSWANEVGSKLFPNGNVIFANDYGAVDDTTVLSTKGIQDAIDACHNAGGGTVKLAPGRYTTGALFIKSGVNFEVGRGVTLYASNDINHYPEFHSRIAGIEMLWPSAVLNVIEAENVAITGEGTIDCQGKIHWDRYWEMRKEYEKEDLRWIVDYDCKRVRGILVSNSSDVTLKDFTIMRTGFWGIQIVYSSYCTASGLTVDNNIGGHGPSTDGIDIDSSSYILVEHCDIDCNDDNICLKAGRDADGLRVNKPTEYVVVRNCVARKGAGLITCGSETSGSIRHILGYDLQAYGTSSVLRVKSALNRGGVVENIFMSGIKADNVKTVLSADLNWNPSYSYSILPKKFEEKEIPEHWLTMLTPVEPLYKGYPAFKNIFLANVEATNVKQFISASGWNDSLRLDNFQLYNMDVEAEKAGKVVYTDNFIMKNIRLHTSDGSRIAFKENNNMIAEIK